MNLSALKKNIDSVAVATMKYLITKNNFSGSFRLESRSKNAKCLVIVLAGYKSYLWRFTLARLAQHVPQDFDVCLVSSGLYSEQLSSLSKQHGWSYLSTRFNRVSRIQNIAISQFPSAEWIFKLDEDIFLTPGFFNTMLTGFIGVEETTEYTPGLCSPILNINGYTYRYFLAKLGFLKDYERAFGTAKLAANGIPIFSNPYAAQWIWDRSLPLDEIAALFQNSSFTYSAVPHRFSIGAILFRREFWKQIGGIREGYGMNLLGHDERHLCRECMERSRPVVVLHNAYVGHFSFGPQETAMRAWLALSEKKGKPL